MSDDLVKPNDSSNSEQPSDLNEQTKAETKAEPKEPQTKPTRKPDNSSDNSSDNSLGNISNNKKNSTNKFNRTNKKDALFNAKSIPKLDSSAKQKVRISPIVFSVLILLLISSSVWIYYQQQLAYDRIEIIKNQTTTDIKSQEAQVKQAIESNTHVVNEINQLKQSLQNLAANNNDLNLQLLSAQEKIKALSGRKKQDWMLAEVEYLVNIAEQKLTLQKDKNTAIQLLKTADQRLIEIADQSHFQIRESIARDISNLSLIQESDITGIVISLNALEEQIKNLEILALKFEEPEEGQLVIENMEENNEEGFIDKIDKIYQRFISEFIVIKNHAEAPQPLMTPKQRGNLNLNIQLALQQAQVAAMQGNETLYLLNIEKSKKWINTYFGQSDQVTSLIEQLDSLKSHVIDVRYPTHLEATKIIEAINKEQLYQWLDNDLNSLKPSQKIKVETPQSDQQDRQVEPSL